MANSIKMRSWSLFLATLKIFLNENFSFACVTTVSLVLNTLKQAKKTRPAAASREMTEKLLPSHTFTISPLSLSASVVLMNFISSGAPIVITP